MRLSNASFGYFGLFLAQEMARLGQLETLFTNLPFTHLAGLPAAKYQSRPLLAAPLVARKLGLPKLAERINPLAIRAFDRWVARALGPCDVFHNFSSFGLESFRSAAQRFGALTIVERGSSHIQFQDQILREEYRRWELPFAGVPAQNIERELEEYAICDRITVQSSFAERTFLERGVPARKLIKLPLGVDIRLFRPVPKRDRTFRVLYAGSASIRKGVPYLLEAVSTLRLADFELVLNGSIDPELAPILRRYPARFRNSGFQPLARLHELYSQASVLVLPTIEDGFARVLTEAMACGVPVISTTHCGASDVLDDGVEGFLIPARSAEAIRERVSYLYEHPEVRDRMAQAALRRATGVASWDAYGPRAAAAYRGALAEKRGASAFSAESA